MDWLTEIAFVNTQYSGLMNSDMPLKVRSMYPGSGENDIKMYIWGMIRSRKEFFSCLYG